MTSVSYSGSGNGVINPVTEFGIFRSTHSSLWQLAFRRIVDGGSQMNTYGSCREMKLNGRRVTGVGVFARWQQRATASSTGNSATFYFFQFD